MALINRFEDIIAWQEARKLVKNIYQITREGTFAKDFDLRDKSFYLTPEYMTQEHF
jgi:hypothetical protein